jgi:hypothetical protein
MSTTDRTPQELIDQWRLHPDPEVGSCANQLAGWLREQEEEKDFARVDGFPGTSHGDLPRRPSGDK